MSVMLAPLDRLDKAYFFGRLVLVGCALREAVKNANISMGSATPC